jgi:peptidoglycan/xylan/chitin deacetylase (PgdA/CDA1 family)
VGELGPHLALLTFDVDAESAVLAHGRRYAEHAMVMTHQAFGPRVGVPRILRLLAEYSLPATFFVPGLTAERYPQTVAAILDAGHEVGHHSWSHRSAVDLDPEEERADFERALTVLQGLGADVRGHRAASWEASWRTPSLVAEHGLLYDSSLMDSDSPYVLETDKGDIVELPPFWGLDDWEQYAYLPRPDIGRVITSPLAVAQLWIHELDAMRSHGGLFVLTCHPFLTGRAGRIEALRSLIEAAIARSDVEFKTGETIARVALDRGATPRWLLQPVVVDKADYPDW